MRLPFTRHIGGRLGWSYAAVIVVLTLGWSMSSSALSTVDTSFTKIVTHIDGLATAATNMTTAMLDQETGARGYLLTGNTLFLQPYTAGQQAYPAAYAEASRLVANATDRQLLRRQDAQAQLWQHWMATQIRDMQTGHLSLAVAAVAAGGGKQRFDAFRAAAAALAAHLQQERRQELATSQASAASARSSGAIVFFGALVPGCAGRLALDPLHRAAPAGTAPGRAAHEPRLSHRAHAVSCTGHG